MEIARRPDDSLMRYPAAAVLQVTGQLSATKTLEEVSTVVTHGGARLLDAVSGFVAVPTADAAALQMLAHVRIGEQVEPCMLALDAALPVTDAYRMRVPVLLRNADELYTRYAGLRRDRPRAAIAALPLVVDNGVVGAICFTFADAQPFDELQQTMLRVLADLAAQALRRAELESQVEALKREFVVTASHELRTPLAAIYGAAVTLQRDDVHLDPEVKAELVRSVLSQSERLRRVLDDLLVTSELDAGRLVLEVECTNVRQLVLDATSEQRKSRPDALELALDETDAGHDVAVDAGRLQQVIANLVDNALKYSPQDARVCLDVALRDDTLHVAVADRGRGMTPAQCERVFEKFYRADPDHRQGVAGTGLGLYICQQLVQRMGGRIWIEPNSASPGVTAHLEVPAPLARP